VISGAIGKISNWLVSSWCAFTILVSCIVIKPDAAQGTPMMSTASLAFGAERQTLGGERDARGSGYLLSVGTTSPSGWSFGLQTAMLGLRAHGTETYRFGAGPMLRHEILDGFRVSSGLLGFRESTVAETSKEIRNTRGYALLVEWEKFLFKGADTSIGIGGYYIANHHLREAAKGNSAAAALIPGRNSPRPLIIDSGIEITVDLPL
jgi:hypothetical protein